MAETESERIAAIADRDSLMWFGKPYEALDERESGELAVWACKGYGRDLARAYAARDGHVLLARLTLLFAPIDEARSRGWRDTGWVETIAEAQAIGTPAALDALCERLEATWHDGSLTSEQVVEAVERVEALRLVVRRMHATGMLRLADGLPSPGTRPLPRQASPREVVAHLVESLYGPLPHHQRAELDASMDAGWRFDIESILTLTEDPFADETG